MATAAAKRYARAVFELAQQDGQVEEWHERLERVHALISNDSVAAVLTNPTIPVDRRMALITAPPHQLDKEATNLARLLIESGRVAAIAEVVSEFDRLADAAAGRVRATVTTAVEMEAVDRDLLAERLSKQLGGDVRLEMQVDARILGGLKLQYGDHLIDASVAARLQQLRRRLAEAS